MSDANGAVVIVIGALRTCYLVLILFLWFIASFMGTARQYASRTVFVSEHLPRDHRGG
jgi:hypothetical protein